MVTKSSVFTILKVTKLGFDCILTPKKIAEAFILLQTCLKWQILLSTMISDAKNPEKTNQINIS